MRGGWEGREERVGRWQGGRGEEFHPKQKRKERNFM